MKKEQIIEILKEYMDMEWDECANEILALKSEITNADIKAKADLEFGSDWTNNDIKESWIEGAEWVISRLK